MRHIIIIDEKVTMHQAISDKEGIAIYDDILSKLREGEEIELDFQGIIMMTTAFLNVIIGQLYKDYTTEFLREKIFFKNITTDFARRIKDVTDNAKLFYKEQDVFTQNVEDIING